MSEKTRVGIAGYGWVGKSMHKLFPDAVVYDKLNPFYIGWQSKLSAKPQQRAIGMEDVNKTDICFICVPSPCPDKGALDTSIVEEVVKECKCPLIVVRSTVNPGDCDRWEKKYKKNIIFVPEYLGETPRHPLLDEKAIPFIIIGGKPENCRKLIELYTTVYNANVTIRQMTLLEAEIVKLSENRAIAFKVMQMHELYKVCEKAGVDYYKIRDAVYGDDPRFTLWFTFIFKDNLGFQSSKCLKKDVPAWVAWAKDIGYKADITALLVRKSEEYEKDR